MEEEEVVRTFTDAFEEICEFNGIEDRKRAGSSTELELFQLVTVDSLSFTKHFRNLTELRIYGQERIESMKGIENCPNLLKLSICECSLRSIDPGLLQCKDLVELNLSSNHIKSMGLCRRLVRLERLWLCGNKLQTIEVQGLHRLKQLWLARNWIERVNKSLDGLHELEELNLSHNRLGSFRDLLNLARLTSLHTLFLNDPHFGSNPVCGLSNYHTFALCHLPLRVLDAIQVDEQTRLTMEATFLKKKMYYNMRIKTLQRNTTNVIRKAQDYKARAIGRIETTLSVLIKQQKSVQRELDEAKYCAKTHDQTFFDQLRAKATALEKAISRRLRIIRQIRASSTALEADLQSISDEAIQLLMLELETGGNIRLTEGKPEDAWYTSVVSFFQSQVSLADYKSKGVGDLRVTRVMRVHNRFLKNRMEARLGTIQAHNGEQLDVDGKKLFYCGPEDYHQVVQNGFSRAVEYHTKFGQSHGVIPLSSHMTGNEITSKTVADGKRGRAILVKACFPCTEHMLNVQAGMAREKAMNGILPDQHANINTSEAKKKKKKYEVVPNEEAYQEENQQVWCLTKEYDDLHSAKSSAIMPRDFAGYHAVYKETETKATAENVASVEATLKKECVEWFAFDHSLVIPEYIVEFEHVSTESKFKETMKKLSSRETESKQSKERDEFILQELRGMETGMLTHQESNDLGPLLKPLEKFLREVKDMEPGDLEKEETTAALNQSPEVPKRAPIALLSKQTILNWSAEATPDRVVYLNLHNNSLQALTGVSACVNLEVLVASFNEIQLLGSELVNLTKLTRVELGFNLIKELVGLDTLSHLEHLELNNNLLYRLEDMDLLSKKNPKLRNLNLRNNPLCELRYYYSDAILKFPNLVTFDGAYVTNEDRERVSKTAKQIVLSPSTIYAYFKDTLTQDGSRDQLSFFENAVVGQDTDWWTHVEFLDIPQARIRKMEALTKLTNLRRLSLVENEISRIEGLENCAQLEELSLEKNHVVKIEGLSACSFLKKLELGRNKLTTISGLSGLTFLTQLSLEDNEISQLNGLDTLSSLMELYLGNNRIDSVKEVQKLRSLSKLIIMDLLGNPCCKDPSYRLYTVFHLSKLKVLDGASVDQGEQTAAKDMYQGKVTPEFLEEKVGHQLYDQILLLDLSACRIRSIHSTSIQAAAFSALKELNLERNGLTSLNGLETLPTLQALRLTNNRMSSLEIAEQPNLEVLECGQNKFCDMRELFLNRFPKLKVLHLQSNDISSLAGLEPCVQLRELVLDRNKIRTLEGGHEVFQYTVNLRMLRLEHNSIRALGNMTSLVKLHGLFLQHNRLNELSMLEKLANIPFLLEVSVSNNPVARKQMYRPTLVHLIPTLKFVDGREINNEERERAEMLFAPETMMGYSQGGVAGPQPQVDSNQKRNGDLLTITGRVPIKVQPVPTLLTFPSPAEQRGRAERSPSFKQRNLDSSSKTSKSTALPRVIPQSTLASNVTSTMPRNGVLERIRWASDMQQQQQQQQHSSQATQKFASQPRPNKPSKRSGSFFRSTPR